MKKLKQVISIFLCAVLCCSVFAINAHAKTKKKTVKKYVTSISITKKATITIPADKKTAVKSYKVTVKVKNKASKAFTAKSSKTSVATVKVSGTSVKVTAKKAGTAKITVTTKAKSLKKKKLSKTLTITVKKAVKPAKILPYQKTWELYFSEYGDSKLLENTKINTVDVIDGAKSNAVYLATPADKTVCSTFKDSKNNDIIYSTGAGSTKVDIYEKIGSSAKVHLGAITVKSIKENMSDVCSDAFYKNEKDYFSLRWLKLDLNKPTCNFTDEIKNFLSDSKTGSKIKETDITAVTYGEVSDTSVATVSDEGLMTGLKNGEVEVSFNISFSDGSVYDGYCTIKVTGKAIEKVDGYSMETIRDNIVGLNTPVKLRDGTEKAMINFDNAATTPAFKAVKDAVDNELEMYGSIGRGFSQKSNHSTDVYNSVRDKVLQFLGADPESYTCFYTNSTTDGLNKLASALVTSKNDVVLTTRIEHHANDLSWRERCKVIYAEVDSKGRVIYSDLEKLLKNNKVKILSISAASNVTGYVNDIHKAAKLAHKYGAKIVVDGAQIVAHRKVMMVGDLNDPDDDIDFIAFSAHKMYSPYGGGAVVGITSELNKHMPTFYGGGTIKVVGDDWQIYKQAPAIYEAGSPNYPGVVGLGKAIDVLSTIGMDKIEAHEKVLNRKIIDGLKPLKNVIIYGDTENIDDKVGVVTFNFSDINTYFISESLSELGAIATRRGAFCAHPYVWRLMGISDETAKSFENCSDAKTAGMVRVSFGIYNNEDDVDKFLEIMPAVMTDAKDKTDHSPAVPEY